MMEIRAPRSRAHTTPDRSIPRHEIAFESGFSRHGLTRRGTDGVGCHKMSGPGAGELNGVPGDRSFAGVAQCVAGNGQLSAVNGCDARGSPVEKLTPRDADAITAGDFQKAGEAGLLES